MRDREFSAFWWVSVIALIMQAILWFVVCDIQRRVEHLEHSTTREVHDAR